MATRPKSKKQTTQVLAERGRSRLSREVYPEILKRARTKMPKTARGERTRERILASAREIFDKDGYAGARISDIVESSEVALGTFYTYFDDKDDVLAALLEGVFEDLYIAARAPYVDSEHPEVVLRDSIRNYMAVYNENRDLMRTLLEATTIDQEFAALWFEIREHFLSRVVGNIERLQVAGRVPTLDPVLEASALGGMIEHFCWIWFAMGGEREAGEPMLKDVEFEEMVNVVATLWVAALFGQGADPQRGLVET